MIYSSPLFLVFFTVCLLVYYALPDRLRNPFLLLASYVYYMWSLPQYGLLVLATTAACYGLARAVAAAKGPRRRKALFLASILLPLLILFVFKYFNFFSAALAQLLRACGLTAAPPSFSLLLPVGISFYTFQIVGYCIDVYNGAIEPERDFWVFALFVSFFPQILAGPIGRAKEMLPQYRQKHDFDYGGFTCGVQRFLTGAFKKVVVADGLAVYISGALDTANAANGLVVLAGALLYALQIYFDFAGYSDMAVGAAQMLGFTLRENFTAPYFAVNFSGFWKRWHMSLTTWFNDYLFTPLVWSRWADKLLFGKKWEEHKPHFALNLLLVFLVSGLWHGAAWTFLVWGLLNGLYRVGEEGLHKLLPPNKKKLQGRGKVFAKQLGVYLLFAFSLVFFRAPSLSAALGVFSALARPWSAAGLVQSMLAMPAEGITATGAFYLFYWGCLLAALLIVWRLDAVTARSLVGRRAAAQCNPLAALGRKTRWLLYWVMSFGVMLFWFLTNTLNSGGASFIYFGF